MKKILCLLLALALLASLSACAILFREPADAPVEERKKYVPEPLSVPSAAAEEKEPSEETVQQSEEVQTTEEVFEMPSEDDPLYSSAWAMFDAVSPLFVYFDFSANNIDLDNLTHDDFWLLIALSAMQTADADHKDEDGNILFSWTEISDYASCLLGSYFAANGINTYDESYSAYSDPRSGVITLSPMTIDGYKTEFLGFWEDGDNPGFYTMLLQTDHDHYMEGDTNDYRHRWEVVLQAHTDDASHLLPFDLRGYSPVIMETPDTAGGSEASEPEN